MSATAKNPNSLALGLVLIVGAYLYSKNTVAQAAARRTLGAGSMPGNVGTGTNQVAGGVVGSLLNNLFATATQAKPRWTTYDPTNGVDYDPRNADEFIAVQDIYDSAIDGKSLYGYESVGDIMTDVVGGGSSVDSIIKVPGAYW